MKPKIIFFIFSFSLFAIMGGFYLLSPSYEKSLKAKYYYEVSDYKEAYNLAKEAFSLDVYNRMAATIMAQSQNSLRYVRYNDDAKKYTKVIDEIALHEDISDSDKAKIRMICNIMISAYIKLAPSVITDKELVAQSAKYYDMFEKLLEKVNKR
ncbi:hypothetical protein HUE87_10365 [Candidatus Sulfurimonas marisnigri]|uniref:Uncharacterized protein n=1 Tax=Candidatus Sulfurimonas marisnigri TaxID=2740405 RepID=A0A7S7RQ58_9BACT|nr:hypothetical protein [Candidatus Sulfurimonas marisnigri]QOY54269.1 hypothetical protein HUE87_10365 [Candidatus Sulfurimonas marisnigri]